MKITDDFYMADDVIETIKAEKSGGVDTWQVTITTKSGRFTALGNLTSGEARAKAKHMIDQLP